MKVPDRTREAATSSAGRLHRLAGELAEGGMLAAAEIVAGGALALTGLLAVIDVEKPRPIEEIGKPALKVVPLPGKGAKKGR